MNKKIKSLLASGIVSLGMIFGSVSQSNALSYGYIISNLNLRQYAGTYSNKLMTIPKGSKIAIYGSYGNWYRVYYGNKWGYVCKDYVNKGSSNSNTNVSNGKVLNKLIIVNTYYNKIYLYENSKLVWSRPCASGKSTSKTPVGDFQIINKVTNPYYSKGNIKGGDPRNPLGCRWLGIGGAYGIHGNNDESSISKHISNGCIRLHNWDIKDLYNRVSVGTKVVISAKPVSNKTIASWYGYKVY